MRTYEFGRGIEDSIIDLCLWDWFMSVYRIAKKGIFLLFGLPQFQGKFIRRSWILFRNPLLFIPIHNSKQGNMLVLDWTLYHLWHVDVILELMWLSIVEEFDLDNLLVPSVIDHVYVIINSLRNSLIVCK